MYLKPVASTCQCCSRASRLDGLTSRLQVSFNACHKHDILNVPNRYRTQRSGVTRTPSISEIRLADSIASLRILFDSPTDRNGVPLNGSCASILNAASLASLGSTPAPSCAWENSTALRIGIGGAPSFLIGRLVRSGYTIQRAQH